MTVIISRRTLIFTGCVSLSLALAAYYTNTITQPSASEKIDSTVNRQLLKTVRAIAVKITVNRSSGSGIIIQKNNNIYTIITNRHVIDRGHQYQVTTVDRRVYQGNLAIASQQDDLAILEFTSDRDYPVANINLSPVQLQESLFAIGFPFSSNRLQITLGKLFIKTNKPLKQGYQLGYSNTIYEGMSGGAILNSLGEVVGVNGRSASPIIADYQYQDTTYPSQQQQQQMMQLSWGIPIGKAVDLIK